MALLYFAAFGILFYAQSSLWESVFHEYVLDVRPRARLAGLRHSRWLSDVWYGAFSHGTLHHYLTFRNDYARQFADEAERTALMARLSAFLTPAQFRDAVSAQYGNSLTWASTRYCGLPIWLNLLWLFAAPGPGEAAAIAIADLTCATPYLLFSKYVHPYLHEAYDSAIARAPSPVRHLLRSRYGLAMRVSHFVHHRHPTHNFNLHIGADIPRRRWLPPTDEEWTIMLRIGLIKPIHRARLRARPLLGHGF
jgi:hypothetical protein